MVTHPNNHGLFFIYAALAVMVLTSIRSVLYLYGLPSPQLVSILGNLAGFGLLLIGAYRYTTANGLWRMTTLSHRIQLFLWVCCVGLAGLLGFWNENESNALVKEFISLNSWVFFLLLGASDRFWLKMVKPMTLIFYLGAVLVVVFADAAAVVTNEMGTEQLDLDSLGSRNQHSLGFRLRPLVGAGLFLFIWGVVNPQAGIWKLLQLGALPVLIFMSVGIFVFRGSAIMAVVSVLMVLIVRPMLETRSRPNLTAFLFAGCALGALGFSQTEAFEKLTRRAVEQTQNEGFLTSRTAEYEAYVADMGWEVTTGRGLGGSFDATGVMKGDRAHIWQTTHFGLLVLSLKGGVLMTVVFLAFLIPGLALQETQWYQNPMNLTAALYFPIILANYIFNPIYLAPESIFGAMAIMMSLARFGRTPEAEYAAT